MHITKVLSHLGAWDRLCAADSRPLADITAALEDLTLMPYHGRRHALGRSNTFRRLENGLAERGWAPGASLPSGERLSRADLIKDGIVIEIASASQASAIVDLFARFPLFMRTTSVQLPVLIVTTTEAARLLPSRIATFEHIEKLIEDLHPLPLSHPFVVLGISTVPCDIAVRELSTDLDRYLVDLHGLTFAQMLLARERPEYDFKEVLPDNDKVAKELCGFANRIGGGTLIVGVTDDGYISGLDRTSIDDMQLRVSNIASTACSPVPQIEFRTFAAPSDSLRALLTIRVGEVEEKPCMTRERVYVRYGTSARPARPDEIRRLVLG